MVCTPRQERGERIFFFFFLYDLVFKYHKTVGCNFWQPQGSRFTGKFGIGTPPENKSFSDTLRTRRQPIPNRWCAHLGRNVEKESFFFFFCTTRPPNTTKRLDATFGGRRGAVLQQNLESAHHPKIKVSLTRYELAVSLDPIDGVHTSAETLRKNLFFFFFLYDLVFK